jgi:hypothetical protein
MKVDLSKANAALKSRERRTGQNATPIPNEVKELAKTKAKLEVEAGHLKRQHAKHGKTGKPVAAVAKPTQGPAKKKHNLEEAANLVPGWKGLGPQERLTKLRELNRQ